MTRLESSDIDLAVASTGSEISLSSDINAQNFALAYRWNEKIAMFFDDWFIEQVIAGVALNDQGTLRNAAQAVQQGIPTFLSCLHSGLRMH